MTLEQYKAIQANKVLREMADDIRHHSEDFAPQTITEEYYLSDMRYYLIPANKGVRPYKILLHGYGLEIHFENRWPAVFQFQSGKLQIGNNIIVEDCMERAVEDIRYLCSIFPIYAGKYLDSLKNAAVELQKDKMIREICESTVSSALLGELNARGMTCKIRRLSDMLAVTIWKDKGKNLVINRHIPYDEVMPGIEWLKDYIANAQ